MRFDQRSPVPGSGALQAVEARFPSTFDWRYALERSELLALYEKGPAAAWNAADLDWSQEAYLMRERLLMEQVFERMGLDTERWLRWSLDTPFMQGFRQMLFSKIVPNLKRLGLLTPRVRAAYEKLDPLRYEDGQDSTQDAEITPPAELVTLLLELHQGKPAAA